MKVLSFCLVISLNLTGFSQLLNGLNQYMVYQPLVNAASIGSYSDASGALYYRNQWVGFPGAPVNMGARFLLPWEKKNSVVGMSFMREQIGVRNESEFTLDYAYRFKLKNKTYLSLSLSPKISFIQAKYSELVFNDIADPSAVNYNIKALPNFAFGVYIFRDNYYVGFSVPDLLSNNIDLASQSANTDFDLQTFAPLLHAGYKFDLNDNQSLTASVLLRSEKGASASIDLNLLYGILSDKVGLGVSYRANQHLIAMLKLKPLDVLSISYAYQYTFSGLSTHQSGSHELLLSYTMKNNKSLVKINAPRF